MRPASAAVARAFRETRVPVNISAGTPLAGYPVVACALELLGLDAEANEWTLLSSLARARYLAGSESEGTRRGLLDARLRRRGQVRVSLRLFRETAQACGSGGGKA